MVQSLKKYIISTNLKSGATNKLCYCRACFNKLGENHPELKKIDKIFSINKQENTVLGKRALEDLNDLNPVLDERRESFSSRSSLTSLPSQWSNYGPMDSFVARSLSSTDKMKFNQHLLQVTISCGFSLS
ncbi:hypothetical protein RhiirA1_482817 [Rhizophagus irregularis]|uniref:Uncharacterized protein n=1 Tax=Rhizophagus irregularis TaxID=588596 RepID=A0A2N0QLD1_9GLOM|nr:hypothetical protein RhiirA1_482817 [Rhizophagus irregularis]